MDAEIGKVVLTEIEKMETKMIFELDNSTKVKFEKESYHMTIIQDGHTVFLDKKHVEMLIMLCKEQNFLG